MADEINPLKENDSFEFVTLLQLSGGKWVYGMKENSVGEQSSKARYVEKGHNQVKGIDYQETFSITESITLGESFDARCNSN